MDGEAPKVLLRDRDDKFGLTFDRVAEGSGIRVIVYFNDARPHQGIGQLVPANRALEIDTSKPIVVTPVLGELHADYRRAA